MNVSDIALEDDASRIEIDSRAANNAFMDGLPVELKAILIVVWNRRISPFGVCRIAGEKFMKAAIEEYLDDKIKEPFEKQIVG